MFVYKTEMFGLSSTKNQLPKFVFCSCSINVVMTLCNILDKSRQTQTHRVWKGPWCDCKSELAISLEIDLQA